MGQAHFKFPVLLLLLLLLLLNWGALKPLQLIQFLQNISTDVCSLRHYLQAQSQGHHTIDCLEERSIERASAWRFSFKGWRRAIVNQTNIESISKAILGKLLRDRAEGTWIFPSAQTLSWSEVNFDDVCIPVAQGPLVFPSHLKTSHYIVPTALILIAEKSSGGNCPSPEIKSLKRDKYGQVHIKIV